MVEPDHPAAVPLAHQAGIDSVLRILGPVEAHDERGPLTLGGVKPRAILAVLLLISLVLMAVSNFGFAMLAVYAGIRNFDRHTTGIDEMA